MADRPVIAVVYDLGAVSPLTIVEHLEPLGDVLMALRRSEHTELNRALIEELATVVDLDPDHDTAAEELRRHRPDALLTFSETCLGDAAELAERLGLPFHSVETVGLLRDKYAMRARLREHGVDAVRSARLERPGDWPAALAEVGLPAVLKPATGQGSRDTHLITEEDAGRRLAEELLTGPEAGPMVLEEYLRGRDCGPFGDYVSVESAVVDGEVTHWQVTGKYPLLPPFREPGQYWPAPIDDAERAAALTLTTRVIEALGVRTGITHTELKLTAEGPRLIELNGRLGGYQSWLTELAGGLDPMELAGRIALGQRVEVGHAPTDRVYFVRSVQTPREGGLLKAVHGLREVLDLPGVEGATVMSRPGEQLPPTVSTAELVSVTGIVEDHAAMLAVVEKALGTLTFTIEGPDGERTMTSAECEL
ncbi:ATP-grasp domain-containing protein [Kitasatospora sp. NPDC094028]